MNYFVGVIVNTMKLNRIAMGGTGVALYIACGEFWLSLIALIAATSTALIIGTAIGCLFGINYINGGK